MACEASSQGRRLDYTLACEVFMGWRHDGQAGRRLATAGHAGGLGREPWGGFPVLVTRAVAFCRLLL